MTIDDLLAREAIRATLARYTTAGDRLRAADFLATFTADGVIEASGCDRADSFRLDGRDAIGAWFTRWRERPQGAPHAASFVRHHLSTCRIELTGPAMARVRTYWVAWTDIGPDHAGHYLDDFRREGAEWLIAHRRIREDWRSPDSLFGGAVGNTIGAKDQP